MPELPEVETVARGVDARLRGDRIEAVWFSGKKEPFKSPAQAMAEVLPGNQVKRVFRVGKHIVFDLVRTGRASPSKQPAIQWTVHLGMSGRLLVASPSDPVSPHTHAILRMRSKCELRFVDPRRFGRLALHAVSAEPGGSFAGAGREPLTISTDEFAALFHSARTSIKAALLDQSRLQGVGNIYADESLFRAGIRPRLRAASLSRKRMDCLCRCLKEVLKEAILSGGSSVSDYVDADGARGFFQLQHKVYRRTNLPCLVCGTPIRRVVVAGRGTHYCPRCQS